MTKKKVEVLKSEPKVKKGANGPEKMNAIVEEAKHVPEEKVEEPVKEEKPHRAKEPETKFKQDEIIKHNHRLWQCISMNSIHDAVFAMYSHLNNRADKAITMTVSNDPSIDDFEFERYS
jgi:hypothetical protein